MKTRKIGYWLTTGTVAFAFAAGGIADLVGAPEVVATMQRLGYPAYVAVILGGWKILGAAAIVAPRTPRLKEWAYAGMVFDLSGAVLSHAFASDPLTASVVPLILLGLVFASSQLRPESRRLKAALVAAPSRPEASNEASRLAASNYAPNPG